MVRGDLFAEPRDRSLIRAKESGQAEQQARFASPRPTDDTDDLAPGNVETDFTKRRRRECARSCSQAINLAESTDAYGRVHRNESPRWCAGMFAMFIESAGTDAGLAKPMHRTAAMARKFHWS